MGSSNIMASTIPPTSLLGLLLAAALTGLQGTLYTPSFKTSSPKLFFDGGCRRSCEGSGGAIIYISQNSSTPLHDTDQALWKGSFYFGNQIQGSHLAEYMGLIEGLYNLRLFMPGFTAGSMKKLPVPVLIYGDSEIVLSHLRNSYLPRDPSLRGAHSLAAGLLNSLQHQCDIELVHVYREANREADRLCDNAISRRISASESHHSHPLFPMDIAVKPAAVDEDGIRQILNNQDGSRVLDIHPHTKYTQETQPTICGGLFYVEVIGCCGHAGTFNNLASQYFRVEVSIDSIASTLLLPKEKKRKKKCLQSREEVDAIMIQRDDPKTDDIIDVDSVCYADILKFEDDYMQWISNREASSVKLKLRDLTRPHYSYNAEISLDALVGSVVTDDKGDERESSTYVGTEGTCTVIETTKSNDYHDMAAPAAAAAVLTVGVAPAVSRLGMEQSLQWVTVSLPVGLDDLPPVLVRAVFIPLTGGQLLSPPIREHHQPKEQQQEEEGGEEDDETVPVNTPQWTHHMVIDKEEEKQQQQQQEEDIGRSEKRRQQQQQQIVAALAPFVSKISDDDKSDSLNRIEASDGQSEMKKVSKNMILLREILYALARRNMLEQAMHTRLPIQMLHSDIRNYDMDMIASELPTASYESSNNEGACCDDDDSLPETRRGLFNSDEPEYQAINGDRYSRGTVLQPGGSVVFGRGGVSIIGGIANTDIHRSTVLCTPVEAALINGRDHVVREFMSIAGPACLSSAAAVTDIIEDTTTTTGAGTTMPITKATTATGSTARSVSPQYPLVPSMTKKYKEMVCTDDTVGSMVTLVANRGRTTGKEADEVGVLVVDNNLSAHDKNHGGGLVSNSNSYDNNHLGELRLSGEDQIIGGDGGIAVSLLRMPPIIDEEDMSPPLPIFRGGFTAAARIGGVGGAAGLRFITKALKNSNTAKQQVRKRGDGRVVAKGS